MRIYKSIYDVCYATFFCQVGLAWLLPSPLRKTRKAIGVDAEPYRKHPTSQHKHTRILVLQMECRFAFLLSLFDTRKPCVDERIGFIRQVFVDVVPDAAET